MCTVLVPIESAGVLGKAGHREDEEVGGVSQQSASWGHEIHWLVAMVVSPAGWLVGTAKYLIFEVMFHFLVFH